MPVMDGYETLNYLKKHHQSLKVIMFSSIAKKNIMEEFNLKNLEQIHFSIKMRNFIYYLMKLKRYIMIYVNLNWLCNAYGKK